MADTRRYRWFIFSILMGIYIIGLFQRLCLGVVRQPLSEEFGMDAALFGQLGGVYFNAYMLMQIPTGMLADSWGARKTILTGGTLMIVGTVTFATAKTLVLLFLGRILCGAGAAMLFIPIMKILSFWFSEREYGRVIGLVTFLGYMGGILAQAPLAYITEMTSWRNVFGAIAFMAAFFLLANAGWLQTRPEEAGLQPLDGTDCRFETCPLDIPHLLKEFLQLLKRPRSWPPAIISLGIFGAFNALSGVWGTSYIADIYHKSALEASGIMSTAILGMCVGSLVITGLSEWLGRRKPVLIGSCTALCLCWISLILNSSGQLPIPGLRMILFVLGFFSSVLSIAVVSIKEMHLAMFSGMAISIYNVACFAGAALASPAIGLIIQSVSEQGSVAVTYKAVFIFCLGLSLLAWSGSLMILETHCRNIGIQLERERKERPSEKPAM
jgi:MFS family permease